jgi:hypothetical protein
VLRTASPRKFTGNRFNFLRDSSPNPSSELRDRSGSVSQKRKNPDSSPGSGMSYASVTCGTAENVQNSVDIEAKRIELIKVKSICDHVSQSISVSDADPAVLSILGNINDAISKLCNVMDVPAPTQVNSNSDSNMVNLGAISKKPRSTLPAPVQNTGSGTPLAQPPVVTSADPVSPEIQGFRDAVKDAERSTLIFNLDMGRVPIINVDTMSKKATLALATMAAKVEKRPNSTPSDAAIATIDDVLSVSSGIKFFGSATKSYKNPRDPLQNSYCTIPVKYEFKDKDTRIQAETILRSTCNVNCTTPYPPILRDCIKKIVDRVKTEHPGNFVKVAVDTQNMVLKVAFKPSKSDVKKWTYASEYLPIPREALDVHSKKIPDNINIVWPVFPTVIPEKQDSNDSQMTVSEDESRNRE